MWLSQIICHKNLIYLKIIDFFCYISDVARAFIILPIKIEEVQQNIFPIFLMLHSRSSPFTFQSQFFTQKKFTTENIFSSNNLTNHTFPSSFFFVQYVHSIFMPTSILVNFLLYFSFSSILFDVILNIRKNCLLIYC